MPKHIQDILVAVGIPAEDAAKIDSLPEAEQATFDAKPYLETVKKNYSTQLQNDPAFFTDITLEKLPPEVKKKVESAQYGRAANITRDKFLKGLGMTEADIADLTEEQKEKLELYIPAVTEKYTKTKTGAKEVQEQLIAERKKNEEYQKKFGPDYEETVKTKYETEANQKVTAAIFNANLIGELSTIPGLKIKPSTLAREANEILTSKYAFERIGDFSVELRQKANPQMKVLKNGSSQELTLKDALLEIATERGWVEKPSVATTGTGTITSVVPNQNGQLIVAPHIAEKISKKIASEQ